VDLPGLVVIVIDGNGNIPRGVIALVPCDPELCARCREAAGTAASSFLLSSSGHLAGLASRKNSTFLYCSAGLAFFGTVTGRGGASGWTVAVFRVLVVLVCLGLGLCAK
jgi:hypothetical protein